MARPRKEGMEYFPHDTDARNDLKIRKLRAVFGNDGYTTYFILLENIYRNKCYSLDISDAETQLILAEECKISKEKFNEIITKCIELDLFDKDSYHQKKVLTSYSIKKRTEPIENKRKKNIESYNSSRVDVSDAETQVKTDISDAESTQSKVKKSKVKNNNIYVDQAEQLWEIYPNKKGKATALKKIPKLIEKYTYEQMERAITRYKEEIELKKTDIQYVKHGSTFFNSGYMDYLDKNYVKTQKSGLEEWLEEQNGS